MEININQKKISVGDKYKIFTDGQPSHTASRKLFRFLPEVNLFRLNDDQPVMTIKKRISFFSAKYNILRWDNRRGNDILEFRTVAFWKAQYQCQAGNDTYDIYGHRGLKCSIYKNDRQIAWWDQQAVSWFAGDNYTIIADHDADADLLISFCLVIDNFRSDDHDGKTLTFHLGHIGPQARKFDPGWQPK
jgi:uncharacterized protein YxjI